MVHRAEVAAVATRARRRLRRNPGSALAQPRTTGTPLPRACGKTNRVIVAYEDTRSWGYGAEIAARIADELFDELDAPVRRVAAMDTFCAYHPTLEDAILPQPEDILRAVRDWRRIKLRVVSQYENFPGLEGWKRDSCLPAGRLRLRPAPAKRRRENQERGTPLGMTAQHVFARFKTLRNSTCAFWDFRAYPRHVLNVHGRAGITRHARGRWRYDLL